MTKTEALNAARMALIPSARRSLAQRHTSKLGDCVAWTWTMLGKPYAVAYIGASAKPVLFASFKTEAYTWAEAREQIDAYDQKADHPKSATPRRHASSDARFFAAINASMQ